MTHKPMYISTDQNSRNAEVMLVFFKYRWGYYEDDKNKGVFDINDNN